TAGPYKKEAPAEGCVAAAEVE
ncbi:MAG: hypothetical protein QOI23_529, partial [Chloroflexota bacterium]|nr:hypothetical protein [Chloroflexota bacterium]